MNEFRNAGYHLQKALGSDGLSTLAGIQAAKRTAELIPLCHWVPLAGVDMTFDAREEDFSIEVRARVRDLLDAPRQQVAIA